MKGHRLESNKSDVMERGPEIDRDDTENKDKHPKSPRAESAAKTEIQTDSDYPESTVDTTQSQPLPPPQVEDIQPPKPPQTKPSQTTPNLVGFEKVKNELDATQEKLSEQLFAREFLEDQVKTLQQQVAQIKQLHTGASVAEQECDNLAMMFAKTKSQHERATAERNLLAEELATVKTGVNKKLGSFKALFETYVINRKDQSVDALPPPMELAQATSEHGNLVVQVQELLELLEDSNAAEAALEADLAEAHKTIRNLQKQVQPQEDKVADYANQAAELRNQLVEQTTKLRKTQYNLQQEITQRRIAEQMLGRMLARIKSSLTRQS